MFKLEGAQAFIDKLVLDIIDTCPHCRARVHIEKLWSDYHVYRNGDLEFYLVFRCKPCKKLLIKTLRFRDNPYNHGNYESDGWCDKFPLTLDKELSELDTDHISNQILSDYEEALKCKAIRANRASCSMFRRALQGSLVELGADDKKELIVQITSLKNLSDEIKDWAHQIRIFGNWGAHPSKDNLKDVNEDDVAEAHDFVSKFFIYVFIMPKKVEASRIKRKQKKVDPNQDDRRD